MNAPRKKQVITISDAQDFSGWMGFARKHGNTALTVLLVIAAIVMLIRWRMRAAEMATVSIQNELASARSLVGQLDRQQLMYYPPVDLFKTVQSVQNGANASISNVLNSSDTDAPMRAEALRLRGDLYWKMANFPPIAGSTTQPSLRFSDAGDVMLQKAWDSYQEVLKNSTYANQYEELAAAHMGVAAINENRADWAAAQKEFETVQNDPHTPAVLVAFAKIQLAELPAIQKQLYIVPPAGLGATLPGPANQIGPIAPFIPTTQISATTMPLKK